MKKLNSLSDLGLVFSTGDTPPSAIQEDNDDYMTIEPKEQKPRIYLDRKHRKGKAVTLITGLEETDKKLSELCKTFKSKCGVGGSAKEGEIILQGDQRNKVLAELIKMGYSKSKLAGG